MFVTHCSDDLQNHFKVLQVDPSIINIQKPSKRPNRNNPFGKLISLGAQRTDNNNITIWLILFLHIT